MTQDNPKADGMVHYCKACGGSDVDCPYYKTQPHYVVGQTETDELDAILAKHNTYFWKQDSKTVHLSDKELRENFKEDVQRLISQEAVRLAKSVIGEDENRIHARDVPKHGMYWESKELVEEVLPERDKITRNKLRAEQRQRLAAIEAEREKLRNG
jgi:hypothetical protein